MTSRRQFKKSAQRLGLTENELMFAQLLEEMLEEMKWLHVLGYSNQFLLHKHLSADPKERDAVVAAAIKEVDRHGKLHEWQQRLARIKARIQGLDEVADSEGADAGESESGATEP
ncbi:MAG: hypothetical protein AAF196_19405 [Planctomycetota bacterium]